MKIEPMQAPHIVIEYGGPALADEVFNAMQELTEVINELISAHNKTEEQMERIQKALIHLILFLSPADSTLPDKISSILEGKTLE